MVSFYRLWRVGREGWIVMLSGFRTDDEYPLEMEWKGGKFKYRLGDLDWL